MRWKRLGHVFVANGQYPWMLTHAAYPTIEARGGSVFRAYFACRDADRRSHIGAVDFNINNPQHILQISNVPVLAPGPRGSFDEDGVTPACFLRIGDRDYLYYMGWVVGKRVFARNSIGLAIREKGQNIFTKFSRAPILDRCEIDPYNITYNWVCARPHGGYQTWYGSHLTWGENEDDTDMRHVIKSAQSDDGIHWHRTGKIAISLKNAEVGVSRPTVIEDKGILKMWYSYRGAVYQLGYAESIDGENWQRKDEQACLDAAPEGWEKGSVHYPCVFDYDGQRFMLYNGGRYGSGGFGLAVWA